MQWLYCDSPARSDEHVLPAAFGEFQNSPILKQRLCERCNNVRLGLLDEQLTRSGPEAFLRKLYGVQGRGSHDRVDPFYRGSAGGGRLEMQSYDQLFGFDVLMECKSGVFRQVRQLVFVEKDGRTLHVPIREGTTEEQLVRAVQELCLKEPFETHIFYDPETEEWVPALIKRAWPACTEGPSVMGSKEYNGMVGKVVVTNRYFRAIAKIGFHYFLALNPKFTGHEQMFSDIKRFILTEKDSTAEVNTFIGTRGTALLGDMLNPNIKPNGWRAHVLAADTTEDEHRAYVQTL